MVRRILINTPCCTSSIIHVLVSFPDSHHNVIAKGVWERGPAHGRRPVPSRNEIPAFTCIAGRMAGVDLTNFRRHTCFVNSVLQCNFHTPLLRGIGCSELQHREVDYSYKHHMQVVFTIMNCNVCHILKRKPVLPILQNLRIQCERVILV